MNDLVLALLGHTAGAPPAPGDGELLPWLRLGHGLFNASVILCFLYQGRLGLAIRRARLAAAPVPLDAARRHRRLGPPLAALGALGFAAGLFVVTLGKRNYLEHWPHLLLGLIIVVLLGVSFGLSRRITAGDPAPRGPHAAVGALLLVLYLIEAFLGIGILF